MKESDRKALIALPVVVLLGALVAVAGSQGGAALGGIPVFAMAVGAAFLIQWLAFIPSFMAQTEKFYDLTGTLTYTAITLLLICAHPGNRRPGAAAGGHGACLDASAGHVPVPPHQQGRQGRPL